MGVKKPNHRLVKIHRNYAVEEVASLLNIHKNTVRNWIKLNGLPTCDDQRPTLILGCDLRDFLVKKKKSRKCPLSPGQIYCVRCRTAKYPAGNMAEYLSLSASHGNLIGICPTCDCIIYRRVSLEKIEHIKGDLDVSIPQAHLHINDISAPFPNCDLKSGAK